MIYIYINLRFKSTIQRLNMLLNKEQNKSKELTNESIDNIFRMDKFNTSQETIVSEIITASRVTNLKNRRYSEDWILLCILLKIRYLYIKYKFCILKYFN